MPRRFPRPAHPVERPDGSIIAHGNARERDTADKIAAHLAALAPRRWAPQIQKAGS